MKKIILFLCFSFLLVGCSEFKDSDLIKGMNDKVKNCKNYQITAVLEIFRNEERFTYDVTSTYKEGDYFKVTLINKENNHEQIILKDKESVYVLTPSLNKSFKFQSEWPYNNSQIYLLQPIITDIEKDSDRSFEHDKNGYIITSKVNYPTEKDFKLQKIYFDAEKNITKIEILDENNIIKMSMNIINIEYNIKLDQDFFNINRYQKNNDDSVELPEDSNTKEEISSKKIDEFVYPMYVPTDTYLTNQDIINTDSGERVILTFAGESQFTLIQEKASQLNDMNYVYGDPYLILDTVGAITDYSVSWVSNGVEYSVISDTMSVDELLTVAQSITVAPVGK